MGSKKKDLEIVYNLQWKNRTNSSSDDKSNMVGMYDIPATTLNWDSFKSYLLKHSGTTEDDLKVSYIDSDNKEVPIESQLDFQIALYLFRQRARMDEIITLKLDRISENRKMNRSKRFRRSNDVQTQADCESDKPPEWFVKYMKQFKSEIVDEVTASVAKITAKNYSSATVPCHHTRKSKSESSYKRSRKLPTLLAEVNTEKDTKKAFNKLERKLDHKLEKLEHKTLKIKLKKVALARSSDSDVGRGSSKSRPIGVPLTDSDLLMDSTTTCDTNIAHMNGGETYVHQWEVVNSGKLPWTEDTELRYAWGSQALNPSCKRVKCPHLQPGEKDVISVVLNVPETPGNYECYWHFHHNGRRFGHWLGCHVIVDEPATKKPQPKFNMTKGGIFEFSYVPPQIPRALDLSLTPKKIKVEEPLDLCTDGPIPKAENVLLNEAASPKEAAAALETNDLSLDGNNLNNDPGSSQHKDMEKCIEEELNNLALETSKLTVYCSDYSDNQSIISIADSNFSLSSEAANEYVIVENQVKENVKQEEQHPSSHNTTSDIEILEMEEPTAAVNETPTSNGVPDLIRSNDGCNFLSGNAAASAYYSSYEDLPGLIGNDSPKNSGAKELIRNDDECNVVLNGSTGPSAYYISYEDLPELIDNENHIENTYPVNISSDGPVNLSTKNEEETAGTANCETKEETGYAYVVYEGQKIPMPKRYLSANYLATAEEAPQPQCTTETIDLTKSETSISDEKKSCETNQRMTQSDYVPSENMVESSHCSAVASSFSEVNDNARLSGSSMSSNNRLFVFPQNCPGFEVVYPSIEAQYREMDSLNRPQENCTRSLGPTCKSPSENSSWSTCSNMRNDGPFYYSHHGGYEPHIEQCYSRGSSYSACHQHVTKQSPQNTSTCPFVHDSRTNGYQCMHCCGDTCVNMSCYVANPHVRMSSSYTPRHSSGQSNVQETVTFHTQNSHVEMQSPKPESSPLNTSNGSDNNGTVHILPETVVTGAAILASSALNTARNVWNIIIPKNQEIHLQAGRWENGHWITTNPESPREVALRTLAEMGFLNRDLNATLLARYNDDLARVISELVQ